MLRKLPQQMAEKQLQERRINYIIKTLQSKQTNDSTFDDVNPQTLLSSINAYAKQYQREDFLKQNTDHNSFQADLKLFTDWFKQNQGKKRSKMEFYYVPFMKNEKMKKHIMHKINCRRVSSLERYD